jgi:hypothetical protein
MSDFPSTPAGSDLDDGLDADAVDRAVTRLVADAVLPDVLADRHLALIAAAGVSRDLARAARTARPAQGRKWRRRVVVGSFGFGLATTLFGGVGVAAAANSRPGDFLYGVKTAREHLQLAFARAGDDRAALHLRFARTRLGEAASLLRDGHTTDALRALARADADLAAAEAQGSDDIDASADDALSHRVEILSGLLSGGLPDNAADAAREAIARALQHEHPATGPGKGGSGKPTDTPATPTHSPDPQRPTAPPRTGQPTPKPAPSRRPTAVPTRPTPRPHPTAAPRGSRPAK